MQVIEKRNSFLLVGRRQTKSVEFKIRWGETCAGSSPVLDASLPTRHAAFVAWLLYFGSSREAIALPSSFR
jgi:hypothetical protein